MIEARRSSRLTARSALRRPDPVVVAADRVTPARRAAYAVVRRVFEQGAYADRALHAEARGLEPRERAFAMQLAFGTVQRRASLDHMIEQLAGPVADLDAPTRRRAAARALPARVPRRRRRARGRRRERRAGQERHGGGHKLVNAVLRRVARELPRLPSDDTPAGAAVAHSHPQWLVELWWRRFGADDDARAAAPRQRAGRVSRCASTRSSRRAPSCGPRCRCPRTRPATSCPRASSSTARSTPHGHELWRAGAFATQSRAAQLVARSLDPQPGERVLDLCAAPGGKTTHLAALMGDRGEIVAVERHAGRARALQRTARADAGDDVTVRGRATPPPTTTEPFDRVLLDPPCSGSARCRATPTCAGA